MFLGSSQASIGELKQKFEVERLEQLKDIVKLLRFGSCPKARGLFFITVIDGINER